MPFPVVFTTTGQNFEKMVELSSHHYLTLSLKKECFSWWSDLLWSAWFHSHWYFLLSLSNHLTQHCPIDICKATYGFSDFLAIILKKWKETSEINLKMYFTWPNICKTLSSQHVIDIKIANQMYFTSFFVSWVFGTCLVFYIYTFQFKPGTFQMLSSHIWSAATLLGSTDLTFLEKNF